MGYLGTLISYTFLSYGRGSSRPTIARMYMIVALLVALSGHLGCEVSGTGLGRDSPLHDNLEPDESTDTTIGKSDVSQIDVESDSKVDDNVSSDTGENCEDCSGDCDDCPNASLTFPLRGIFYYPGYPDLWNEGGNLVFYQPNLGYYSSDDLEVVDRHIEALDYAKIQVAIVSWWGIGIKNESSRIPLLMDRTIAAKSKMRWVAYYEKVGYPNSFDTSVDALKSDLEYLRKSFTHHPAYAHIDGKPVIFAFNYAAAACDLVDRFIVASENEWYVVLKAFDGFEDCPNQPDSWHRYAPSSRTTNSDGYSYVISPGLWKYNEPTARLERDEERWYQNVRDMTNSSQDWHLITTFNEWLYGTSVESASAWQSKSGFGVYLDALHSDGKRDNCPSDPNKSEPGFCGCGKSELDSDGDGMPNCLDVCPGDANKIDVGLCGCGVPDTDSDHDGVPDCLDS